LLCASGYSGPCLDARFSLADTDRRPGGEHGQPQNQNPHYQYFPDELLIAIFWEETLFQNIVQFRGAEGKKGLRFGQVQEDTLPLIKVRTGKTFPPGMITSNDAMSVEVASTRSRRYAELFQSGSAESAYKVGWTAKPAGKSLTRSGKPDWIWRDPAGTIASSCRLDAGETGKRFDL
jgi:hypothetical protein